MRTNKLLASILSVVLSFTLVACGGTSSNLPEGLDLIPLGDQLLSDLDWADDLAPLDQTMQPNYFYQADFEDVSNSEIYVGGGFIAEEIILLEAVDSEAADRLEAALNEHYDYLSDSFGNYTPEELENIEEPAIVRSGNYVFGVISQDNDAAESLMNAWTEEHSE